MLTKVEPLASNPDSFESHLNRFMFRKLVRKMTKESKHVSNSIQYTIS